MYVIDNFSLLGLVYALIFYISLYLSLILSNFSLSSHHLLPLLSTILVLYDEMGLPYLGNPESQMIYGVSLQLGNLRRNERMERRNLSAFMKKRLEAKSFDGFY